MKLPPVSRRVPIRRTDEVGESWGIAEEVPVEIGFNGRAWTVMIASPTDLEDLAVGLAVSEALIDAPGDISAIDTRVYPEGIAVDLQVDPSHLRTESLRRRALDGRTGCGLCGVETLADAVRRPASARGGRQTISRAAVERAFETLPSHQVLNRETRSAHAAAWVQPDGSIELVREDVGRHNALDKLVGALAVQDRLGEPGFIVMSSRCSFELVCKAAHTGASLLATVSAPTGLALDLAEELDLRLACLGPSGEVAMFGVETVDA